MGSADMCIGWGEAFQNDPQELATQQETVAPLSPEQMAALNQYIAQVAVPLVKQNAASTTEKAASGESEPSANAGGEEGAQEAACVLRLTPEQMLYYCFSLWYFSSGEAGDQVAQLASARTQQQASASASGEAAEAESAELATSNANATSGQQEEQATHESTERASSPGAHATTPTDMSSSTSIAPRTAPSPSTVPEASAASVDSALSLSSATADVASVCASQPSSNSPPEQSSSPAPGDSFGSESSAIQLQQQQSPSLSFGVFHNGTLYFGAEAARIAAKVLNQGAPAPPMPSLYYCEPLASPLALAAASSQMGSVFFSGAAANASAVGAVAPYFDAYPDAEVLDQQLQRLNLHPAGFGDSGSLPLVTA